MKPGDKFKAQGKNPPQGGSYIFNPAEDEFECISTPGEDMASDVQGLESSVPEEPKTPKAPNSRR